MAKIKNDPAQYQKRAISAPHRAGQSIAMVADKSSPFFTERLSRHQYLDLRAARGPSQKPERRD